MKCTGLVFKDPDDNIVLVHQDPYDKTLLFDVIEDNDGTYKNYPLCKVDVVQVTYVQEDVFTLDRKYELTIERNNKPYAITKGVDTEYDKFYDLILGIYNKAEKYMEEYNKRAFDSQNIHI